MQLITYPLTVDRSFIHVSCYFRPDLEEPKQHRASKKYSHDSEKAAKEHKSKSSSSISHQHKKEKKKDKEKDKAKESSKDKKRSYKKTSKAITPDMNTTTENSANLLGTSIEDLQISCGNNLEKSVKQKSHKTSKELKNLQYELNVDLTTTSKKKKEKKEKHHSKEKKKSHKKATDFSSTHDYEEALGVSTPSKEIF